MRPKLPGCTLEAAIAARGPHCPSRGCVCGFLLINFKTLRIFFRVSRGVVGEEGVKIGDGRRVGCRRREGLLNRLVRGPRPNGAVDLHLYSRH